MVRHFQMQGIRLLCAQFYFFNSVFVREHYIAYLVYTGKVYPGVLVTLYLTWCNIVTDMCSHSSITCNNVYVKNTTYTVCNKF